MFRKVWRLLILTAIAMPSSLAGTLRVGVPEIDGDQVLLPVMLEGDTEAGVAALDFTLNYDPAVFTPLGAQPSAAAQAARKQVESNEVGPGNYVVMMFGMNQTTVDNGQVATITLRKTAQPSSNQSAVSIAQTTFASVEGQEIASEGSSQTVTFPPTAPGDGGNGNPPPVDETPNPGTPPTDSPTGPPPTQPNTPTPGAPGVPGAAPVPPAKPDTDSPRATPMVVASAVADESGPTVASTNGVARMNRAAQELDQSRAALGPSSRIASSSDTPDEGGNSGTSGQAPSAAGPMNEADSAGQARLAAVSSIESAPARQQSASPRAAPSAADASGISPAARQGLILTASAVAVCLLVYRFARRRSR